ncbi:twin-arginine translocation signal domain-containing protein [Haladaptatus paucihalophilus]|uniref:twin-arginine translocation signal domain-containing protein n=1 Tax=Haladaptatus paucihalophilus TaxID=367189 RepID=UPI0009D9796C
MMDKNRKNPTRRNVLKGIGTGAAALTATGLSGTTADQSLPYKFEERRSAY